MRGCFLFSLHALVATALLTRVGLYVYLGLNTTTVQDQWDNQLNRTCRSPLEEVRQKALFLCEGNISLSVSLFFRW